MDLPARQLTKAPGTAVRVWRFLKWRKAWNKSIDLLLRQSLAIALYPHRHEDDEAQDVAEQMLRILRATPIPGEEPEGWGERLTIA